MSNEYMKDIHTLVVALQRLARGHAKTLRAAYVDMESYLIDNPDYRDGWKFCGRYSAVRKGPSQMVVTIPKCAPEALAYEVWLNEADELMYVPTNEPKRKRGLKHD